MNEEYVLERAEHMTFPLTHVEGVAVTVVGAARSGVAVARMLHQKHAQVFVSDSADETTLTSSIDALQTDGIAFETGRHSDRVHACDLMVLSPGVPSDAPVVLEAIRRGISVVSEIECASWFCPGPVAAITGSNGKTTTTALIGRMLGDARVPTAVAGNIGTAFSAVLSELRAETVSVLEVSSFQLDHIHAFRPKVSVLLNVTADHMDRYRNSMERYVASKARITMNQGAGDLFIYNADDDNAGRIASSCGFPVLPFSTRRTLTEGAWIEGGEMIATGSGAAASVISVSDMSIRGMHNVSNAMAAVLVAQSFGVSVASIRATLMNFKGVPHRLEPVREVRGISFVNDSKATNVESVLVALQAFEEPVVLILGGRDKGNDYGALTKAVGDGVRGIIAIGESADTIVHAFSPVVSVERADSMDEAVRAATTLAKAGDVVLLSPACASFDWFDNYEHRGDAFKNIVENL